jgi:hypothetical protein
VREAAVAERPLRARLLNPRQQLAQRRRQVADARRRRVDRAAAAQPGGDLKPAPLAAPGHRVDDAGAGHEQ